MKKFAFVMVAVLAVGLSACGGGGGGGGACPSTEPATCISPLSGEWEVTDTISTSSEYCAGADGEVLRYTATVTQVGCAITVVVPDTGTFSGFVDGNTLCWSGSYPFNGGTTTITGMSLEGTTTTFSGTATWTWTDGIGNCEGSTSSTGSKI